MISVPRAFAWNRTVTMRREKSPHPDGRRYLSRGPGEDDKKSITFLYLLFRYNTWNLDFALESSYKQNYNEMIVELPTSNDIGLNDIFDFNKMQFSLAVAQIDLDIAISFTIGTQKCGLYTISLNCYFSLSYMSLKL